MSYPLRTSGPVLPVTPSELQRVFRFAPGRVLVLRPDAAFTIVAASNAYLQTTHTDESIFGRPLFEVFPDNPAFGAHGAQRLSESLQRVIVGRVPDAMPPTRYDVHAVDGGFEERHWLPVNAPVLAEDGSVDYILHSVDDATIAASDDAVRILDSIGEGFFTLDRQWRFGYVNAEAHRSWNARRATCATRCSGRRTPAWRAPNSSADTCAR